MIKAIINWTKKKKEGIELSLLEKLGVKKYQKRLKKQKIKVLNFIYKNNPSAKEKYQKKHHTFNTGEKKTLKFLKKQKRKTYYINIAQTIAFLTYMSFVGPVLVGATISLSAVVGYVLTFKIMADVVRNSLIQRYKRIKINNDIEQHKKNVITNKEKAIERQREQERRRAEEQQREQERQRAEEQQREQERQKAEEQRSEEEKNRNSKLVKDIFENYSKIKEKQKIVGTGEQNSETEDNFGSEETITENLIEEISNYLLFNLIENYKQYKVENSSTSSSEKAQEPSNEDSLNAIITAYRKYKDQNHDDNTEENQAEEQTDEDLLIEIKIHLLNDFLEDIKDYKSTKSKKEESKTKTLKK